MARKKLLSNLFAEFGGLRLALWLLALINLALIPLPDTRIVYEGWGLVTTLLVPVLTPLTVMLLLLDALMSRVFLIDSKGPARRVRRRAVIVNLTATALLLLRFIPYAVSLF